MEALEEAIANAIYHRDYQVREPIEIRIYPDSIVILNYGGPDRSIKSDSFKVGTVKPRHYRNRRLGDFLKELDLTEGKATGIPRMKKALKENGSPEPFFDFDEDRTFFEVDFYIHPAFKKSIKSTTVKSIKKEHSQNKHLSENAEKILVLIKGNQNITIHELSHSLTISTRAIEKNIKSLKEAGILNRKGSDKTGHWIIYSSSV